MALPAVAYLVAAIVLAAVLGALLWAPRPLRAWHLGAAALLAYPVARALVAALAVADRLTRYTVLQPASPFDFELGILGDASFGLLLPLAGALLLWRSRAGGGEARSWRDLRAALARVLEPAGLRLAAPTQAAVLDALALLGLVLLLQFAVLAAQATFARVLVTGDESRYWLNLTAPLLVGLSVAAGVSEEFVWRGLLLRALARRWSWPAAVVVQGLLFGFIHAGYGNWAHIVGPALFGMLMGVVALRVSLLAAVVIHAGTDLAYLALVTPQLAPGIYALPAAMTLLGLVALAATGGAAARAVLGGLREGLTGRSAWTSR